ncbi:MAG: anhydro-N-acetylmuramic acid kinase [Bacteroidota bacterium]
METYYSVIGIMSGTSLDGLDLAYCRFGKQGENWNYQIINTTTIAYSAEWKNRLADAGSLTAIEFSLLHVDFGRYVGGCVTKFMGDNEIQADFISSHGHTVFHRPEKNLSVQIGCGAAIAAETQMKVICDFRSLDMAYKGQGAPLVPLGDVLLFGQYDACLNIGGFANISYNLDKERIAYDICPANMVLNNFAKKLNFEFDNGGEIARSGVRDSKLWKALARLPFYALNPPKSLGKEWVDAEFLPLLYKHDLCNEDFLRTLTDHIAFEIATEINKSGAKNVLVTGGGALNTFLVEQIEKSCNAIIEIPPTAVINYKEALIFAFLGVLRERNENNCLKSVTGALANNCGGAVYNGKIV